MPKTCQILGLGAMSIVLTACGPADQPVTATGSLCVDIPNGHYFQFVDGRLINATLAEVEAQESPPETAQRIGRTLAGMGYPWVQLQWDGQTVIISGLARDEINRSDAFIAARSTFEADMVAGPMVERVINNMDVRNPTEAIAMRLTEELESDGFRWLSVVMAGRVATLTGTAPNAEAKEIGYSAGRATVESDRHAGEIVNIVVDAIAVDGAESPVGEALVVLESEPDRAECQAAFDQVMSGRNVAFMPGESIVERESSRLLDAITGVALLCEAHNIEIAGYSDRTTSADLSRRRASAIRDYAMAYGADPEALFARGYSNAALTDSSEDDIPNRETAFFVIERED